MAIIQIYTDETKDDNNSFQVVTTIWGQPIHCESYKNEVERIILSNSRLGADFKGLHAYKLGESNWSTLGSTYEAVLQLLFSYVGEHKLNLQITLVSKNRFEANAGFLKNLIKVQLDDRTSVIGNQFKNLAEADLPALYHRIDQLFIYMLYRDKFGENGDQFEFYPDSVGKILSYREREFLVSGNLPIEWPLNFYELVRILGNSFSKVITLTGWPVKQQDLIKFEPQKWSSNYLIQSCDIVSNFTFNYIRHLLGRNDRKYELKANALNKYFSLDNIQTELRGSFALDPSNNDLICMDQDLLVTIDPIIVS